jgi:hypothetical protein
MGSTGEKRAREWPEIDGFDGGFGWIAHPEETMQRASHALVVDGDVWVIDPVDVEGIDERLAESGEMAGVVVLLDRHERDAATLARRHDVAVHLPRHLGGIAEDFEVRVELFRDELAGTGYHVRPVVDRFFWREAALVDLSAGTLLVPEAVGTADYYLTADERLGVHPALRARPPRSLATLEPERILVGHGVGIQDGATAGLAEAVAGARRRLPRLYWKNAKAIAPW